MKRKEARLSPFIAVFLLILSLQIAPLNYTQTAIYADNGPFPPNPQPDDSLPPDSQINTTYIPGSVSVDEVTDIKNPFDFIKQIIDNIL